ncbi:hypothetical protein ACEWY4_011184 [Coilia grayii]|uniref:G-protein coupled receptors family 1 profile domain-containing protein n=1 Tax=Coilia grayii TaxID=363190 RepID=A0ABD1K423_9TELE
MQHKSRKWIIPLAHLCIPPHRTSVTPRTAAVQPPVPHLCNPPRRTCASPRTAPVQPPAPHQCNPPVPHRTSATPAPHLCNTPRRTCATPRTAPVHPPVPHQCNPRHRTSATPRTAPVHPGTKQTHLHRRPAVSSALELWVIMLFQLFNATLYKQDHGEAFLEFLNNSTPFCSQFMSGQWYCYFLLVLFSFALPVGIVGNIAALLGFSCFRKSTTTGTVFLLNLALCDLAWLLMLPFTIYFTLQRPYLQGIHTFCQLKKVSFNVSVYGSIFFLTLISFDRYVGTVHPIRSLSWWDVGRARLCSGTAWALLLLGSIPDLFVTFGVQRADNVTVCMDHIQGPFEYVKSISLVRTLVGFVLPFAAMLGFYVGTVRAIRGLSWRRSQKQRRSAKGKPLLLVTAALLVFVVSFVPYHVMIVVLIFLRVHDLVTPTNTGVLYAAYELLESMCSVSSCLDPILYILASERFQRKLQCLRQRRSRRGGGEGGGGGGVGGGGGERGGGPPIRLCNRASRRVGVEG